MKKILLIALFGLLVACSRSVESPTKQTVKKMINSNYASFSRTLHFDIGRTGTKCFYPFSGERNEEPMDIGYRPETDIETVVAVSAGLITVKPVGTDHWDLGLTDKAKQVMSAESIQQKYHRVGNGCDEYEVSFPIATAYVETVKDPSAEGGTFAFPYSWKWRITELGETLRQDGPVYSRLTPTQRHDLEEKTNISFGTGFESVPVLPYPVPSEAENAPHWGTALFTKKSNGWAFDLRK